MDNIKKLIIVVLVLAAACIAAYSSAPGPSVIDTIRLSNGPALNHPGPITADPADGSVFVASNDGGNVVKYNPQTKLIVGEITGFIYPEVITVNDGKLYVASFDSSWNAGIQVYSAASLAKTATIPSLGWYVYSMRIDPSSNTLYYGATNRAFKVNLADNTQEELFDFRTAIAGSMYTYGSCINIDKERNRIYFTCAYYNTDWSMHAAVISYDPSAKQVVSVIPIGQNPAGFDYRYDSALDGKYLFVTQMYASAITVVNVENNSVEATIQNVSWPQKLALNKSRHRLYVVDNYSDKFHIIDTQSFALLKSFCPGDDPSGVCVDEARDRAYAANHWSQDVAVVSCSGESLIERVPFVPATPLDALVSGGKLYVSNGPNGGMFIIDPSNNLVSDRIFPFSYAPYYSDLVMPAGILNVFTGEIQIMGQSAYTVDEYNQSVAVFDLQEKKFVNHIGLGTFPTGVAKSGSRIYFPFVFSGSLCLGITDGNFNEVIDLGTSDKSGGIAVNATTQKAYIADYSNNQIAVAGITSKNFIKRIDVGYYPAGVAVNEATNRIYVANYGSDSIAVIDGASDTLLGYIDVGSAPWGIEANASSNRVYAVNSGDKTLSVINGADNTVVAVLQAGNGAKYCGVNQEMSRVYVPNQLDGTITVIEDDTGSAPPPPPPPPAEIAKATIKNPNDGKRICGNAVTIFADITQGTASGVLFQYKRKNSTQWVIIDEKDTKKPFHVYWNTRELQCGEYKLRAIAYNADNVPDPLPGYITVYIDDQNPDIVEENKNGGCYKAQKVNFNENTEVQLGDGTRACIPPGAINKTTFLVIETVKDAPAPVKESSLKSLGVTRKYEFADGTKFFSQPIQISLPYKDENNDGIVDGTSVKAEDLKVMYFDETRSEWRSVAQDSGLGMNAANTDAYKEPGSVSVKTSHFTMFGLFYAEPNADLNSVIIYPNPFRPYQGHTSVTFDGLTQNAKISIYTVSGRVVRELSADSGGKLEWDALNDGGEKVASGVYIYCVTNNKGQKTIGKFAVIR
ncbi:MAG: T9SS type A sorting domain-containing protein [Elusimicrobiota bacterium]